MVLLAAAPLDRLFVHTGGEDERDRQLLDDLGLGEVRSHRFYLPCFVIAAHSRMSGSVSLLKPKSVATF